MDSADLRPATPDDLAEVAALVQRAEQHDGLPRVLTVDELREELDVPYVDLALDTRVAVDGGQLVGWSWVWNPPVDSGDDRAYLFGEVDPRHRGRGVGRALLGWGVTRARERLTSHTHDLPRYLRVSAYEWLDANHHLYARFGFTPVRWFEELVRPLTDLPDALVPDGAVLVPWPGDRDEDLRQVRNDAFADHWGSAAVSSRHWQQLAYGHGSRPDLSLAALDAASGEVVGLCISAAYPEDDELTGRREAWIETLGTVRSWRKRGLASAMIARSLASFASAGFTHALLGVDADSPTGAARLYRNLGFERQRASITHQIEVPSSDT